MSTVWSADRRYVTRAPGRVTHHSFSFDRHYDPANVGFGPLVAHNDDLLAPGGGYDAHSHSDVEIVTWVVSGTLHHTDAAGRATDVPTGWVQAQTAGTGIVHSETAGAEETRFLQTWVRTRETGLRPSYSLAQAGEQVDTWLPLASGTRPAAVRIEADATLWLARLSGAERSALPLPEGAGRHVYVVTGSAVLALDGGRHRLGEGDSARLDQEGAMLSGSTGGSGQVLVWTCGAAPM
jgi:redox-sensitive bicupin YhaK (pirin superfamily)